MAVESDADLLGFFDPTEFGTEAVIAAVSGPIEFAGIIDSEAGSDRPGSNSRSGSSPFLTGAADAKIQTIQMMTPFAPVSDARAEDTLTIAAGPYAGAYRIRDIQRDGEVCRLLLNKR
jgi:hypothetical protein